MPQRIVPAGRINDRVVNLSDCGGKQRQLITSRRFYQWNLIGPFVPRDFDHVLSPSGVPRSCSSTNHRLRHSASPILVRRSHEQVGLSADGIHSDIRVTPLRLISEFAQRLLSSERNLAIPRAITQALWQGSVAR
jgi:hypothetical protein